MVVRKTVISSRWLSSFSGSNSSDIFARKAENRFPSGTSQIRSSTTTDCELSADIRVTVAAIWTALLVCAAVGELSASANTLEQSAVRQPPVVAASISRFGRMGNLVGVIVSSGVLPCNRSSETTYLDPGLYALGYGEFTRPGFINEVSHSGFSK